MKTIRGNLFLVSSLQRRTPPSYFFHTYTYLRLIIRIFYISVHSSAIFCALHNDARIDVVQLEKDPYAKLNFSKENINIRVVDNKS